MAPRITRVRGRDLYREGVRAPDHLHPISSTTHDVVPPFMTVTLFMFGCMCVFYIYTMNLAMSLDQSTRVFRRHGTVGGPMSAGPTPGPTASIVGVLPMGGLPVVGEPPRGGDSQEPLVRAPVVITPGPGRARDESPLRAVLRTHVGIPSSPTSRRASISVILDTNVFDLFGHVSAVVQHAVTNVDLFVYVGIPIDTAAGHTEVFYNVLHNSSVPSNTSAEFVAVGISLHTKQQTRLFNLALHALSELNRVPGHIGGDNFLLILHHSCLVDSTWDVETLPRRGSGFLRLSTGISKKELFTEIAEHDLGLASGLIGSRRFSAVAKTPFHCNGNIMHALHGPRVGVY